MNSDGRYDRLELELIVPLSEAEHIQTVRLALTFDVSLREFASVDMQGLAYLDYAGVGSGALLVAEGPLVVHQRQALPHDGTRNIYNVPVIDYASTLPAAYDLPSVIAAYLTRNETTQLQQPYTVWQGGRVGEQSFVLRMLVRYDEQLFWYRPGFWEELKFGWMQYLALLVPLWFV